MGIIVNTAHEGGEENESEKSVLVPSITADLKLYKMWMKILFNGQIIWFGYHTEIIKSMNYLRFLVTVPHSCFYFGLEYTGWIFRLVVFTSIYVLWYYIKYVLWFTYHFGCYQNCNKCLSYATDFNLLVFMMLFCFVQVSILHSYIH